MGPSPILYIIHTVTFGTLRVHKPLPAGHAPQTNDPGMLTHMTGGSTEHGGCPAAEHSSTSTVQAGFEPLESVVQPASQIHRNFA